MDEDESREAWLAREVAALLAETPAERAAWLEAERAARHRATLLREQAQRDECVRAAIR